MAFNYSNPYASTSQPQTASGMYSSPPIERSTFSAMFNSTSEGYQLFWSGLPLDIREEGLRDTLASKNISLNTSTIRCFYAADGNYLGMALIQVSNADDAERLRREFSGRAVDDVHLSVQHMLAPSQTFPSAHVPAYPMQPPPPPAPAAPRNKQERDPKGQQGKPANGKAGGSGPAPGLSLLKRIGNPGNNQQAMIARQKANLKGKSLGDALSSRISGPKLPTSAAAKGKNARNVSAGGSTKVARAKASANKDAMEIDRPMSAGKKAANGKGTRPEPVTQQKLDEEMRLWERQRKFAK